MSADSSPKRYVKIWAILLALFAVSVIGPMFEIKWLTLITAFGIAGIKSHLVIKEFMHLHVERKFITYMLGAMLMAMVLLYFGTAADVMKNEGQNWKRVDYSKKSEL